MSMIRSGIYRNYIKRVLDIILSVMALFVLSPVLLLTTILVRVNLGKPIIYKQYRPGKDEKIFTIYKFRTMTDARDKKGELLSDKLRLTNFGIWLRSTSLDELPELYNVFIGDMSIIGPRPLLVKYLPLYNDMQRRRHEVRPGLSGLAQVKGRNTISWEERFNLDLAYVDKVSLWMDIKIMMLTIIKVLKKVDINSDCAATMPEFTGSINTEELKLAEAEVAAATIIGFEVKINE